MSATAKAMKTTHGQAGNVLLISLIVLLAMALAGFAMIRSIDTSVLTSGNIALRKAALHGADLAIEEARTWLLNQADSKLHENNIVHGYYASASTVEPSWESYEWSLEESANPRAKTITDARGNQISYVIERLCRTVGDPSLDTNSCLSGAAANRTEEATNSKAIGAGQIQGGTFYYYRVTARITADRNSVSYIQGLIEL